MHYFDSHASRAPSGVGYEVFMLMEYCSNHGLIDFMNTRLVNKLTEPEILEITANISLALCEMHYLEPPLLHRDLKIENVLIDSKGTYKLCDFGSASPVLRPPRNAQEFGLLQDDIMRHTTPQYRAPEMIDLYRGFPIDEKSDIWALGVFIYKLCYYTTPFEDRGEMAILQGSYIFPQTRNDISSRLKSLISHCLLVDPRSRPNTYQIVAEIFSMRGVSVPILDKYSQLRQTQRPMEAPLKPISIPSLAPALVPSSTDVSNSQASRRASKSQTDLSSSKDPFLELKKSATSSMKKIESSSTYNNSLSSPQLQAIPKPKPDALKSKPISITGGRINIYNNESGLAGPITGNSNSSVGSVGDKFEEIKVQDKPSNYSKSRGETAPPQEQEPIPQRRQTQTSRSRRPVSMYASLSSQQFSPQDKPKLQGGRGNDVRDFQKVITSVSGSQNIVELSPGQESNIDSNMEFLRQLDRQSSGGNLTWRHRRVGSRPTSIYGNIHNGGLKYDEDSSDSGSGDENVVREHTGLRGAWNSYKKNSSSISLKRTMSGKTRHKEKLVSGGPFDDFSKAPKENQSINILDSTESSNELSFKSHSIQSRIQSLLNRDEVLPSAKTASGYGKYTDDNKLQEENETKSPQKPNSEVTTVSKKDFKSDTISPDSQKSNSHHRTFSASIFSRKKSSAKSDIKSAAKSKPKVKLPPPVPSKPKFLKSPENSPQMKRDSIGSNMDVDQFEKQYPDLVTIEANFK